MPVSNAQHTPPSKLTRRMITGCVAALVLACPGVYAASSEAVQPADFDLGAYKGKVVYLDFWASWCGPCKESFPYMQGLKKSFAKDGLEIVAVNVDRSQSRADAFLNQMQADLPVIYDPKGEIAKAFKVKDMPTSILIDRKGRVRYVHDGFHAEKTPAYDSHLMELLHEK